MMLNDVAVDWSNPINTTNILVTDFLTFASHINTDTQLYFVCNCYQWQRKLVKMPDNQKADVNVARNNVLVPIYLRIYKYFGDDVFIEERSYLGVTWW